MMNENYNTPNSGCCGRPFPTAPENKCNHNDCCMNEYAYKQKACIREKQPDCEAQAVIPSITVETVDGITNLANCLVHVTSTNTTYYVDDKHRVMITWAGPVNIPGYDMVNNPEHFKNQIVSDIDQKIAVLYDNNGRGFTFAIEQDADFTSAVQSKLDQMAADGTLGEMIEPIVRTSVQTEMDTVVTPALNAQDNQISTLYSNVDNFENTVSGQIAGFTNLIQSVTNGSPLVATSTAEMTDTTKTYVNTSDGNWYYWDGDSWEIGGTYQASGIGDGTVTLSMLGSDVKYNIKTRNANIDREQYMGTIELDLTGNLVNKAINDGNIGGDSTTRVSTQDLIYVPFGYSVVVLSNPQSYEIHNYFFNDNLENSYDTYTGKRIDGGNNMPYIYSDIQRYVRFRFRKTDDSTITPLDVTTNVVIGLEQRLPSKTVNTIGDNLANPSKVIAGYMQDQATPYWYVPSSSYKTFMPIRMTKGTTYHINVFRKLLMYDNNLEYITGSYVNGSNTSTSFTATQDGYFAISARPTDDVMVNTGATAKTYTPYVELLPPYVQLQNVDNLSQIISSYNILANKKYVALGDSFTHGDFSNAPVDDYHIEDGRYAGQYKVYPYLIGNRNDMDIVNLAQNGMTMCKINDSWTNYISDSVLANIPADADYITVKIGINDNPDHNNSPLGTIDDDTDATFYGSYNRVMNYLITNFPDAKIGIIISNGQTSTSFVNAEIAIAKKFGVPYLNETTDDQVPLLIRAIRTDVDSDIKTARNDYWAVSTTPGSTNRHPNAKCHVYESTIVEDFLRRL